MAPARVRRLRHPARLVVLGFAALIGVGTALLCLPVASSGPGGAPFRTAIFQSTSATTLAGLATVDVSSYWSPTGQAIILVLMEVGGLGIVTSALLLFVFLSRGLGLRERLAAQAETHTHDLGGMRRLLVAIVGFTVAAQVLTALVLFALLMKSGRPAGNAVWEAVFHAVSAFNNVGLSNFPGGLTAYAGDPGVLMTLSLAVIVGGLGFPVLLEVRRGARRPSAWSLHAKLTLLMTGVLLVVGIGVVTALEWSNPGTLGGLGIGDRLFNGVFAGVMPRTSGFNAVDYAAFRDSSLLFTDLLMFAGGGSASVAGGIKVTTLAVLFLVVWAEVRGDPEVSAFRRRIPASSQRQALTLVVVAVNLVVLGSLAVLATNDFSASSVIFEVVSAFATTGLSTGITSQIDAFGQAVLMVLMFLGRIGPLTLGVALVARERERLYSHPEERPLVG